jgi:hypothetical protein
MAGIGWLVAIALAQVPSRAPYPAAPLTPIGGEVLILGQRQRTAFFSTPDEPRAVIGHFARRWRREGLPVLVQEDPSGLMFAGAFATAEGVIVLVSAQRASPHRTLAFLVVRDAWRRPAVPAGEGTVTAP